jgi:HK97 family phage major capsid protein
VLRPFARRKRLITQAYSNRGVEDGSDLEKKVLVAGTGGSPDPSGWQTVPEVFSRELIRNLVLFSPMRSVARVQQVSAGPVLIPKRTATMTAAWTAETVEHAVSEPSYTQLSVGVFVARVTTEVTNQLLEDSAFDLAAELARDFVRSLPGSRALPLSKATVRPSRVGGSPRRIS